MRCRKCRHWKIHHKGGICYSQMKTANEDCLCEKFVEAKKRNLR